MSSRSDILSELDMTEREVQLASDRVQARIEAVEDARATLDDIRDCPCTRDVNGMTIHRYQIVAEEPQNPLDDSDIHWVVTGLEGEEIVLKVPGPWDRQAVPVEQFTENRFTPIVRNGIPLRGY